MKTPKEKAIRYLSDYYFEECNEYLEKAIDIALKEQAKEIFRDIKDWKIKRHFDGDYVEYFNTQLNNRLKEFEEKWLK